MSEYQSGRRRHSKRTEWIGLLSVGFFVLALGFIWIVTPDFYGEVVSFVKDFQLKNVTEQIMLPAPASNHPILYTALSQLCLAIGFFQIVLLALRFYFRDSLSTIADAVGGMAFFLGIAFFLNLMANEALSWFGFIGGVIVCVGVSIILSSMVKLLSRY
jgi:hypothetical protein